jgi:hypothetical protein
MNYRKQNCNEGSQAELQQCLFSPNLANVRQISPKFDFKEMISTYTNHFSWKNGPISPDFEFFFKIARFLQ